MNTKIYENSIIKIKKKNNQEIIKKVDKKLKNRKILKTKSNSNIKVSILCCLQFDNTKVPISTSEY